MRGLLWMARPDEAGTGVIASSSDSPGNQGRCRKVGMVIYLAIQGDLGSLLLRAFTAALIESLLLPLMPRKPQSLHDGGDAFWGPVCVAASGSLGPRASPKKGRRNGQAATGGIL